MKAIVKDRSLFRAIWVFLVLGLATAANAQSDYDRVFVFGDSLSDSGNIYALTGETSKAPYALIPSYPYAIGGHHFSNGKTWAEMLAQSLSDNNGGKASRDAPGRNGNYAHGGARARSGSGSAAPSSTQQVAMFIGDFGVAPSNALYVLQFGGNDLRDALIAGQADPNAVAPILQAAIGNLATAVQTLYFAGARNFLIANAPNIEHAPAVQLAGAGAVAGFLTGLYNGGLEGALQQLEAGLPGTTFHRLNMASLVDEVVDAPAEFGIVNVTSPCLNFLVESDATCDNPEDYFFWDGLHPTRAGHAILAGRAQEAIAN